jgi:hypothetical protein
MWCDLRLVAPLRCCIPAFLVVRGRLHGTVCVDDPVSLIRFLERMAATATDCGPIGGGSFRAVPLCVMEEDALPANSGGGGEGGHSFTVDTSLGFLTAPVSASADEVYTFVQASVVPVFVLAIGGGVPWCGGIAKVRARHAKRRICRPLCFVKPTAFRHLTPV